MLGMLGSIVLIKRKKSLNLLLNSMGKVVRLDSRAFYL